MAQRTRDIAKKPAAKKSAVKKSAAKKTAPKRSVGRIRTLDQAGSAMSTLAASAAIDADEANVSVLAINSAAANPNKNVRILSDEVAKLAGTYVVRGSNNSSIRSKLQTAVQNYAHVKIDGVNGRVYTIDQTITMTVAGCTVEFINGAKLRRVSSGHSGLLSKGRFFSITGGECKVLNAVIEKNGQTFDWDDTTAGGVSSVIRIESNWNTVTGCKIDFTGETMTAAQGDNADRAYAIRCMGSKNVGTGVGTESNYNFIAHNKCIGLGINYANTNASYNTVFNNWVVDSATVGLRGTGDGDGVVNRCIGNNLLYNKLLRCGGMGIESWHLMERDRIIGNDVLGVNYGNGGYKYGISAVSREALVEGNLITGAAHGTGGGYGYCIEIGANTGNIVRGNQMRDHENHCIGVEVNLTAAGYAPGKVTIIENNDIDDAIWGIAFEGSVGRLVVKMTGNQIKNARESAIHSTGLTATPYVSLEITSNFIEFTVPNTAFNRTGIMVLFSGTTQENAVNIDKNIIRYHASASGGPMVETGIWVNQSGHLITHNEIIGNSITGAGAQVRSIHSGTAITAKLLNNTISGAQAVSSNITAEAFIDSSLISGASGGISQAQALKISSFKL